MHDGKEEKELTRDQMEVPEGWLWKDDLPWKVDMGRAVDDQGWEYAIEAGMGNWVPYERNGYLFRRRRWVRLRVRDRNAKVQQKKKVFALTHFRAIYRPVKTPSLVHSRQCFNYVVHTLYVYVCTLCYLYDIYMYVHVHACTCIYTCTCTKHEPYCTHCSPYTAKA